MAKLKKVKNNLIVSDLYLEKNALLDLEQGIELNVNVRVLDSRYITDKQRKFIFALCGEYEHYTGTDKEYFRLLMQQYNANLRDIEVESLAKASVNYANGLIDTIINYFIDNEIPYRKGLIDENNYTFTSKQVYAMALKRVCVVCGTRADLHHLDKIGMGNSRNKISHLGMKILPLCRNHHNEAHTIGDDNLMKKYHLEPIVVDAKLEHFIKKGTLKTYKGE